MSALDYVRDRADRLIGITRDLVRMPSENVPPKGSERQCQEYVASVLRGLDWEVDVYELGDVRRLHEHPLFWPGRDYSSRPNVTARLAGTGGGRSLLLSGHIDTVPRGAEQWSRDAFGGEVDGNCLYGRGSMDMKAGVASALFVAEAVRDLDLRLAGDLLVESVVDEEFGGVNGTLAGRLRGWNADAAVIGEPSGLRICPAQRGGRIAHITFRSSGDIFADEQGGVIEQLTYFLSGLPRFAEVRRQSAPAHEYYAHMANPAPVTVTRIFTAPWGTTEPIAVPRTARVELYWQAAPGETQQTVESQFWTWLDSVFTIRPEVEFPIRWLPPSALAPDHPLITELSDAAGRVLGEAPLVQGLEAPCDMYVLHGFGIPAVLWGPRGANAHAADEYVEIDSLISSTAALLEFVIGWCGNEGRPRWN